MKKIILLLFLSLLIFACSGEQKIKRKLHSGNGQWEIIEYKRYYWSPTGVNNQNIYLCANCGTIEFKRNGSGTLSMSDPGGMSGGYAFSYTNTEEILSLFTDDGGAVYDITWDLNRKKMTLSQNLGHAGYVNVITCKKK